MSKEKPVTQEDAALARKHLAQTIAFNRQKAKDHREAAKKASGPLAEKSRDYNLSHSADHEKDAAKAGKQLGSDYVKVGDLEKEAVKAKKKAGKS